MAEEPKVEGAVKDDATGKPAAGAQAEEKLPFNEHPRWKEVYGAYSEYKKYGKPQDIEAQLNRAAELEAAFEEAARQAAAEADTASKTKAELADDEVMKQARKQIEKLLPELEQLREMQEAQQAQFARLEQAAVSETRKVLAEMGEGTDRADILAMSDILADVIKHDPELYAEYGVNPRQAVRGAFDKFAKRFGAKTELSEKAKTQKSRESAAKLPKVHGAGGDGGGDSKGGDPPKSLKEATERAVQRLKGMEL